LHSNPQLDVKLLSSSDYRRQLEEIDLPHQLFSQPLSSF
jgi:hypothetical protein